MNYVEKAMKIIKEQFLNIMSSDADYYSKYNVILSNEQQYVKNKNREPNTIYIVVKFMNATVTYGQTVLPININALGEENHIEVCQRLLLEFAQTFTLSDEITIPSSESGDGSNYIIKQVWNAPQIMSNFNSVYKGFRSLFYMSGTFLLGKDSLPITNITYYTEENNDSEVGQTIEFINASWEFTIQLDSQAFYQTNSRTKSASKIGTLGLSILMYFANNTLCNKLLGIAFDKKEITTENGDIITNEGVHETFYLSLTFANGVTINKMRLKIASAHSIQNLGEFPMITLSFTN